MYPARSESGDPSPSSLSNVPGLSDGIADDSWPLAIWVGLSALYALGTVSLAVRRALS